MSSYTIIDEPRPGAMARIIVHPLWPLISFMLGSAVFSWIWYGLNSQALGSATRKKEFGLILTGVAAVCGYVFLLNILNSRWELNESILAYIRLGQTAITLYISYSLYRLQFQSYNIYLQYGGEQRSGVVGLILAFIFGVRLQTTLISFFFGVIN